MHEFDRLPEALRVWLATAVLPWRPRSVLRVFDRVLSQGHDTATALATLDQLQRSQVARDACVVWGPDHPQAAGQGEP